MANRPSATGQVKTKSGKEIAKAKLELEQIRQLIAQSEQLYNQRRNEINIATQIVEKNKQDQEILAKKRQELKELLAVKQQYELSGQNISAADEQILKNAKDEVALLEAALVLDEQIVSEKKDILKQASDITSEIQNQRSKYSQVKDTIKSIKDAEKERRSNLLKEIKEQTEYSDNLRSIGSSIGKQNDLYEALALKQDAMNATLTSAFNIIDSMGDGNERVKDQANNAVIAYKDLQTSITAGQNALLEGKITQEEYNNQIVAASDEFDQVIKKINTGTKEGRALVSVFNAAKKETVAFADAAKRSQEHFQSLDQLMGNFSGIPAMQELNTLLKTNVNNTLAFRGAMMALGAAIGAAAYEYFGADFQVGREIKFKAKIDDLELERGLIENSIKTGQNLTRLPIEDIQIGSGTKIQGIEKIKTESILGPQFTKNGQRDFLAEEIGFQTLELEGKFATETLPRLQQEAKYAGAKAAISFSDSFQQGAAQFRAAAKTARFGEQLGATGFNRGELQLAGIDPSQISDAMSQLAAQTGKVPTAKLATEMTLIAKRTGQSSESVASLAEYFQRADDLSAEAAVNMVEGMRAMAVASNLDLNNLMQGVAESSKDALSYQIKSAEALTKQVAAAQSIGVNFNKLASAGKSMVLNYKDSIKAEMQLSSMLGRSVNLSEVRTKAMSGDYEGMMNALKAQGLNPEDMNMFQQEALQQALGGMDLESIQKIYKGEVKTPADLNAANAAAAGGQFLSKTKQAQATLAADQASISANTAILSAQLENKMQQEFIKQFGPGIESFNALMEALRARQAKDLKQAAESTQGFRDIETQIKQDTQLKELGDRGLMGAAMGVGSGLFGFATSKGLGKMFGSPTGAPTGGGAPAPRVKPTLITKSGQTIGGPKPSAGKGLSKFIPKKVTGKGALLVGALTLLGVGLSKAFGGEKQQEVIEAAPEIQPVDTQPSIDQLRQQILQTNATTNVASEIQKSNNLLTEANKANNLSGICSCIASNMQEQMGMMVTELQNFKAANEAAQKMSAANADTIDYKGELMHGGSAVAMHAGAHFVPTLTQKGYESVKQKIGSKTVQTTEQLAARESTEMVAKSGFKKVLEKATFANVPQVAKLSTSIGKLANPVGWIGLGAEVGGGFLKELGKSKQSTAMYETGRATQTAGMALSYGAMGAMIGSIVPGIGNIVGAAIGGSIGLVHGLMSNYFSEEAQKEAELVKQQEEQKIKAEELNAQIDYLIKIQEPGISAAQKTFEQTDRMAKLAADEPTWRNAMLLQTLEMTRLLSIIASDFVNTTQDGKLKDKLGNEVSIGNYDKTFKLQAERGVLNYDNAREADIAKILGQFNKNPGQKLKIGGEMMDMKGYMEKYKVSQKEIDIVTEKSQFMSMNQNVINQQKLNQSGNKVTPAGGNTNTNVGGNTNTNVGGNTNTNTNVGGNTNTNNTNTASLTSLLTVLQTTQTNDDTRGKIIYGHLKDVISAYLGRIEMRMTAPIDLMNATLLTISTDMALIRSYLETKSTTAGMSDQSSVILKQIQTQAEVRGLNAYAKEIQQNGNLQRIVDRSTKNVDETKLVKQKIQNLNEGTIPSTKNMNDIQIEMLQVLQDHTELLSAVAANTLKPDAPQIVRLDGRTISTNIATRMQQRQTFNKSKTLQYKAT